MKLSDFEETIVNSDCIFVVRKVDNGQCYIKVQVLLDRIKELENALQEVLDSGLLNGPFTVHDEIRFMVFEVLTKEGEDNGTM